MTSTGSATRTETTPGGLITSVSHIDYAGDVIGDSEWSTNTLESGVTITEAQ